jgi:hypothetical protein
MSIKSQIDSLEKRDEIIVSALALSFLIRRQLVICLNSAQMRDVNKLDKRGVVTQSA